MDSWVETKKLPTHFLSAAGLVYKEKQVLLIKSPRRGWEFPGGVIEQGEVITDGLKREIWEESGIIAEPVALVGVYQNLALKKGYGSLEGMLLPPVVIFDFICAYAGGKETASEESLETGWFSPEEALELVKHPGFGERLANMLHYQGKIKMSAYEKTDGPMRNYREIDLKQSICPENG